MARKRILLADDDAVFVKLLTLEFEQRDVDADIVVAENGMQTMEAIEANAPDLVLLDLRMPLEDGFEVLRKLSESNADTAVIVLTHFRNDEFEKRCLELGAKEYLVKGDLRIDQVVERVRGYL